ncbi:hypothetical protein AMTRI_Chr10g5390 [Amborella trichopoda]
MLLPFSHPCASLFLHHVKGQPPFFHLTFGPRLYCPSLNLCHRFLSFANQNAELHLTKSIHQTLKFENQKKALVDSTMAPVVSASKFFY